MIKENLKENKMTESQKEFLFRAMLKDLGVSYRKCGKKYIFTITKKFLFVSADEYEIGRLSKEDGYHFYRFYGMPETNQKIVNLLKEYLNDENITLIMEEDNPKRYYYHDSIFC